VPSNVSRIGSLLTHDGGLGNTGSTTITVPADCTCLVVGVVGYQPTANLFSSGSLTLNSMALTAVSGGDAVTADRYMGCLWYLGNPSTGTQTLAWDWAGSSSLDGATGAFFLIAFYKGVATDTLVRDTFGMQASASGPHSTDTMTAQNGDFLVAYAFSFVNPGPGSWTWSGATAAGTLGIGVSTSSLAEVAPSGTQVVSAQETSQNSVYAGLLALVLVPLVVGVATVTLAPLTALAAAQTATSGALTRTLAGLTTLVPREGALTQTLAELTCAATSVLAMRGRLVRTLDALTLFARQSTPPVQLAELTVDSSGVAFVTAETLMTFAALTTLSDGSVHFPGTMQLGETIALGTGMIYFLPTAPAPNPAGEALMYVYDQTGTGLVIPVTEYDPAVYSRTLDPQTPSERLKG
jgi:hypothetical protein